MHFRACLVHFPRAARPLPALQKRPVPLISRVLRLPDSRVCSRPRLPGTCHFAVLSSLTTFSIATSACFLISSLSPSHFSLQNGPNALLSLHAFTTFVFPRRSGLILYISDASSSLGASKIIITVYTPSYLSFNFFETHTFSLSFFKKTLSNRLNLLWCNLLSWRNFCLAMFPSRTVTTNSKTFLMAFSFSFTKSSGSSS